MRGISTTSMIHPIELNDPRVKKNQENRKGNRKGKRSSLPLLITQILFIQWNPKRHSPHSSYSFFCTSALISRIACDKPHHYYTKVAQVCGFVW